MATPSPLNQLRIPGKLCINPTDLSAAFPHGGTALGMTKKNEFFPNASYLPVLGEEYGGAVVDLIFTGERPRFVCYLREWDSDAIGHIFHNASGAVVTFDAKTEGSRGGVSLYGNAAKLYFSPDAPTAAVGLLGYSAVPMIEASAAMQFAPAEEIGLAVAWEFTPNSSGKIGQIGLPGSLTV